MNETTMSRPDRRTSVWREDLAAASLRGIVEAPQYVEGQPAMVGISHAPIRRSPDHASPLDTEAIYGERLHVYDEADGWAWVQLDRDGYVGYIPESAVAIPVVDGTHRVEALATFVYPKPDIKSPPLLSLPLGAEVRVESSDERFALTSRGYIVARHLRPVVQHARDFVDIAERFIGTPYLWGGRTRDGLDCSGLLQISLQTAGIEAPRDSDMQEAQLGETILVPENLEGLERGDLVFWPGHVAIMVDGVMLLHANAHHMVVTVEPLPVAAGRASRGGSEISAIKRLHGLSTNQF